MNPDGDGTVSAEGKRELLAALLRRRAAEAGTDHPLSGGQKALWSLYQSDRHSAAYNTAFTARIAGPVDDGPLRRALQELTARHPSLRTTFSTGAEEGRQHVHAYQDVHFDRRHLSDATAAELSAAVFDEYRRPFELERGPMMRVTLFSRSRDEHVLLVAVHHIVCDAWSLWIMVDELAVLWSAAAAGRRAALAPPARTYSDFVRWQGDVLRGAKGEELRRYWRNQLAGDVPVLMLPTDRPRPPLRPVDGDSYFFELPSELLQCLRTVAETQGATLYAVLLATFQVLLHRYSHQEDFTFGTLTTGRTSPEFARVVGYFANPVVVRATVRGNPRFATLLAQVRERVLGALAHQDYPFAMLIEELRPAYDPSRTPLMDVLFVYQKRQSSAAAEEVQAGSPAVPVRALDATLQLAPYEIRQMEGQFDLTLEIADGGRAVLKYATTLFERSRIVRMAEHFQELLRGIVANPATRVSDLPLLTPTEREAVTAWNATATDHPLNQCLHERFEEQAARTPDRVAVRCEGREISYAELNGCANVLARRLRALGTRPETVVGVCCERSLEMVVALVGILKAGGAYLPLDPSYPAERLKFMARNAGCAVVLTHGDLQSRFGDGLPAGSWVDVDVPALSRTVEPNPESGVVPDNLAYVIYTSGSTGDPKGAMNTHRAICNRLIWMQHAYRLGPADRVLQKTPFSFDVSVWEFFWPLLNGASLIMARPGGHQDSQYLVETIRSEGITVLHFVPSMLRAVLDEPDLHTCRSITQIFCSGETLPMALQRRCQAVLAAELHNLYGPTEAAVDVTSWRCERDDGRTTVPIGRPIANTQIFILDRHLQPVPVGVPGELYIGGVNLGRGYLNRPDLTADRFIPNPFGEQPGTRIYRTGDVARWLADGTIDYLGRVDHQVKVRGYRIETGEIESALTRHAAVHHAAVIVRGDSTDDPQLVAYVVPRTPSEGLAGDLRTFLAQSLPRYMIPATFVMLDAMPLNPAGKIDRRMLPPPGAVVPATGFVAPRNAIEQTISDVWREILQLERVGVYDDFFELGGNSLKGTTLVAMIARALGTKLTIADLFREPTVEGLARLSSTSPRVLHSPIPRVENARYGGPAPFAGRNG